MKSTSQKRIQSFCQKLRNAGISVNIRTQFGSDINAACGQLAGTYKDEGEEDGEKNKDKEIEQQTLTSISQNQEFFIFGK